jgi:hypothetical protein
MSLKDALAGIKESQAPEPPLAVSKPGTSKKTPPQPPASPSKKFGKSSSPDYEPVKVYVRTKTRKDAARKWEDANGGDFSDLVEHLLTKYLGA